MAFCPSAEDVRRKAMFQAQATGLALTMALWVHYIARKRRLTTHLDWYWTREVFFLRVWSIEESIVSPSSFTTNASRRRWSGSFLENTGKSSESIHTIYSLVWRSMESMFGSKRRSKNEIPVLYWCFRNNCFFPSSSRTFRTQSYWSFITWQCCDSEQIFPTQLPYWMCVQSSFYHQLWINTWRSKFKQETNGILPACWSHGQKVTKILMRLTWMYHVVHNTCTMHGRDIKTRFFGSTSTLLLRKDWHSIKLDRMQSSFKKHVQLIVFQKLLDWKLEKCYTKKYTCHLDLRQRSHWGTNGKENQVQLTLNVQKLGSYLQVSNRTKQF